jgi:PAS domain S-box-containing protein
MMNKRALLSTLKLVIPYLVLGFLWIFLTDRIISSTDQNYQFFQTFKGIIYVALTGILIFILNYFLVLSVYRSQTTYRQIFQQMPIATWISDVDEHQIIAVNLKAIELYGYTESELTAMSPVDLFFEDEKSAFQEKRLIEKEPYQHIWRHRKKDGSILYIRGRTIEINPVGKPLRLTMLRDITQEYLDQKEKELLFDQIVSKNKNLEQFNYVISHNLRSPVAKIKGLLEVMPSDKFTDDHTGNLLTFLQKSANELDEVIIDLSKVLHINKKSKSEWERVAWHPLVRHVIDWLKSENEEVEIVSSIASTDSPIEFYAIRSYLFSILYNLIQNAIKYRSDARLVRLELACDILENQVVIRIKDFGKGIDLSSSSSNPFQLFKRLDYSQEGKGIGLYLVQSHLEAMDGSVTVKSELGNWTEFEIILPKWEPEHTD